MATVTGTSNRTVTIEDGEQVYPCHCGETHRGPYAIYEYGHHNCAHDEPLVEIAPEAIPGYVMCPLCGLTFDVEERD